MTEKENWGEEKQSKPGCYMQSEWRVTLLRVVGIWSQLWQQLRKARSRESEGERLALAAFTQERQG